MPRPSDTAYGAQCHQCIVLFLHRQPVEPDEGPTPIPAGDEPQQPKTLRS